LGEIFGMDLKGWAGKILKEKFAVCAGRMWQNCAFPLALQF
jgi:hypothetical protein